VHLKGFVDIDESTPLPAIEEEEAVDVEDVSLL